MPAKTVVRAHVLRRRTQHRHIELSEVAKLTTIIS